MNPAFQHLFPEFNLSHKEWLELVALEYVLVWNYSENTEIDEKRHKELSGKRWRFIEENNIYLQL